MGSVHLGRNHLRWCHQCNLPILEEKSCPVCHSKTEEVPITPPVDARPAFEGDIDLIRKTVNRQFGEGTGDALVPKGTLAIINRAPDLDRMDEIVVDGKILGALRYDIVRGFEFLPRTEGAMRIGQVATRSIADMDEGAYEPVMNGASALAVGVLWADDKIEKDDQVLLRCGGRVFAGGKAKMTGREMMEKERGSAVKVRWVVKDDREHEKRRQATWEEVVDANRGTINRRVERAKDFIRREVERNREKKVAVSFSGGKDSLATLSLVKEAGIKPIMLFINTGIELAETVENAEEVAEHFGLQLTVADAGDAFWRSLEYFGPPGKDYRWCCKTCKLGPTTQLIKKEFPSGLLSFIGQRGYESQQRHAKGERWNNPWTPNQSGASPIQHWTALHVWLYIFDRKLPYNPWYDRGMERVGCFLCPSTDLGETVIVRQHSMEYRRWEEYLEAYAEKKGLEKEWIRYGLWRWRRVPESVMKRLREAGKEVTTVEMKDVGELEKLFVVRDRDEKGMPLLKVENRVDFERIKPFLSIIGSVETVESGGKRRIEVLLPGNTGNRIILRDDGVINITRMSEKDGNAALRMVEEVMIRATECVGCGICPGRCSTGALRIKDGRIEIKAESCVHCGACLEGPCPVVDFGH